MRRATLLSIVFGLVASAASAEGEIRIAEQFGISYLPLQVMRHEKLIEAAGEELGIDIRPSWQQLGSGRSVNDAMLAGDLDIGAGGVGPLLAIWDSTRGDLGVRGIAAMNSMPIYLTTRNPAITSLEDFDTTDRIALPSVETSVQARTLQMAAEQQLGRFDALDVLTVSMSHPEATAAMLSGAGEVTAHFGSPPFQYVELADPDITRVLNSYDVLGGPTTFNLVWTTERFRAENLKTYEAFVAALDEAVRIINADKAAAAQLYVEATNGADDPADILAMLEDPEIVFTLEPQNTMAYASFMHRVGALKNRPERWQDYFFPEAGVGDGS